MAAYNAGQYIKVSIESVLNQTLKNWELIIINDGSSDDTEDKIKFYDDSRIKYLVQSNRGVSTARNIGLSLMAGNFFCFLDADDFLPPESLEHRYNKMVRNPEIEFLDGKVCIYDRDLKRKIKSWKPTFQGNPLNELLKISNSCFFSPTWMIRRTTNQNYH